MIDLLLAPLRLLYRGIGRADVVDITRLMHVARSECVLSDLPVGYSIRCIDSDELAKLIATESVPEMIGQPNALDDERRALVVAFCGQQVASYFWLVKQSVDGTDNFSRSEHLGTSIRMPDRTAFVYNAWTSPDHRGKRLISSMMTWSIQNRIVGAWAYLTMIDWTNKSSIRAFKRTGMSHLGWVARFGRGPLQITLVPRAAKRIGFVIAEDAPGKKLAA